MCHLFYWHSLQYKEGLIPIIWHEALLSYLNNALFWEILKKYAKLYLEKKHNVQQETSANKMLNSYL